MHARKLFFFLFILFFCVGSTGFISTAPAYGQELGIVSGAIVNVRSGPGTSYGILDSLPKDTSVAIVSQNGDWVNVKYAGQTGWISAGLLTIKSVTYVTVQGDPVNLRSGPGTNYSLVGQVHKNDTLEFIEKTGQWYKIKTAQGTLAYISAELAAENKDANSSSPGTSTSTPPVTVSNDAPSVYINGQEMKFDVLPIIENGRTLVPLRAIFEAMGATVEWNAEFQTVYAGKDNTKVILPINSLAPTINGQVYNLDVPAKIVMDRTLAPLRFVGEAFGGKVDWNESTRRIDITWGEQNNDEESVPAQVVVNGSVVNLRSGPGTTYDRVGEVAAGEVLKVTAAQDDWYQVSYAGNKAWVASWLVQAASVTPPADVPVDTPPESPEETDNTISLSSSRDSSGVKIVMQSSQVMDSKLSQNDGDVVYTFEKQQISGKNSISEALGADKLTVSGKNTSDGAEVEFSFPAGVEYQTLTEDGGKKLIFYIPNYILSLETKPYGNYGENVLVTTVCPAEYSEVVQGDNLEIRFNNMNPGILKNQYTYNNDLLEKITVNSTSGKNPATTLSITTNNLGKHLFGLSSGNCGLNIILLHQTKNTSNSKLVFLDPGHGGKDTGARGTQIDEKDVTLDVALRVGKILEKWGFQVAYSRTEDIFIPLEEESAMANALNARVFVSIHCNSNTSPTPGGTETYFYAPLEQPDLFVQRDERYGLASALQTNLVNRLKLNDRGVKEGNLSVLRNTTMPSALAEMAFISNPTEQNLLMQDGFKDMAAEAIADAIIQFMNQHKS